MDRKSPEVPTSNLKPIHFIEHDDLPTIVGEDGTINYPFGEKNNLVFASANDAHRWKENASAKTNKKRSYETQKRNLKDSWIAMTGIQILLVVLPLLLCFFGDITYKDIAYKELPSDVIDVILISGAGFALCSVLSAIAPFRIRRIKKAAEQNRVKSTYQVFNLEHPLFLKNELLARYSGTIFDLQNDPANLESNRGRGKNAYTSPAAIETGDSTRRMLNEHEEYLGAARRIAELWPDADQPTRDVIVKDMAEKAETLRTACANYQTDADQMATIDREKQDYLAQQEAEAKTIVTEAKAVAAADEYKVIKERYNL